MVATGTIVATIAKAVMAVAAAAMIGIVAPTSAILANAKEAATVNGTGVKIDVETKAVAAITIDVRATTNGNAVKHVAATGIIAVIDAKNLTGNNWA